MNCARWDLCGGRPVMGVPTAIRLLSAWASVSRTCTAGSAANCSSDSVAPSLRAIRSPTA